MKQEKLLNQLEHYLATRVASESVKSYLYIINRFMNHHPNTKNFSLSQIEEYFAGLKQQASSRRKKGENKEKLSVGYRKTTQAAIKMYYEFLFEEGHINDNPSRSFNIDEKSPSGMDFNKLLTMEEMEILLRLKKEHYQNVAYKNRAMIGLLIYQGITSKELALMKLHHIDLDAGTVKVIGQSKNRTRTFKLTVGQEHDLRKYIEDERPKLIKVKSNKLMISLRGTPVTADSIHSFISRLGGAFDKEVSPMNIRNSVISHWLNFKKLPLEEVQQMAGHRYPSSTERYLRKDVRQQREVVSRLHEKIFG
jgi:site-specific recombinase XerD